MEPEMRITKSNFSAAVPDTLRHPDTEQRERELILQYARENGKITKAEIQRLLGKSDWIAYARARALVDAGELILYRNTYYLKENIAGEEERPQAVLDYIKTRGPVNTDVVSSFLCISRDSAAKLLSQMEADGQPALIPKGHKYTIMNRL